MDKDGDTQTRPSPGGSSSSDPPIGLTATVKSPASPPSPRNGLELVVYPPTQTATGRGSHGSRSGGGGGGRDDCWSEEATEILIDAWGERFMELKRGNLKQQHWEEVAKIVNRSSSSKSPKTDLQCKNRIDTAKKKFKQEKAKVAAGTDNNSRWIFFKKLERLIGGATATTTASKASMVTPSSRRSSLYQRKAKSSSALHQQKQQGSVKRSNDSTRWHFRKRVASETESESEPDLSAESGDDSLPPLLPPPVTLDKKIGGGEGRELGEVAMAILGFAESYEKAETVKLKQTVELEKERMMFAKELELQRMQFFKDQLEILRNIEEEDRDGERRIRSRHHSVKDNGKVS
ncbi:unnamed protein product [Thlaspi arvense]|uniref:Myb/SANT-like DNA-binding domain-containing protein n=1 Tax=Thlaspi arvense TaxID=13288 RepID=A0AAU9S0F9_THLAR|nr:unnamed protein product [Thlaspi arvense]